MNLKDRNRACEKNYKFQREKTLHWMRWEKKNNKKTWFWVSEFLLFFVIRFLRLISCRGGGGIGLTRKKPVRGTSVFCRRSLSKDKERDCRKKKSPRLTELFRLGGEGVSANPSIFSFSVTNLFSLRNQIFFPLRNHFFT